MKTRDEWQVRVQMRDGKTGWIGLEADRLTQAQAEAEALEHFREGGRDPVWVVDAQQIAEAGHEAADARFTGFRAGLPE
jgi:hypothetical protein